MNHPNIYVCKLCNCSNRFFWIFWNNFDHLNGSRKYIQKWGFLQFFVGYFKIFLSFRRCPYWILTTHWLRVCFEVVYWSKNSRDKMSGCAEALRIEWKDISTQKCSRQLPETPWTDNILKHGTLDSWNSDGFPDALMFCTGFCANLIRSIFCAIAGEN